MTDGQFYPGFRYDLFKDTGKRLAQSPPQLAAAFQFHGPIRGHTATIPSQGGSDMMACRPWSPDVTSGHESLVQQTRFDCDIASLAVARKGYFPQAIWKQRNYSIGIHFGFANP